MLVVKVLLLWLFLFSCSCDSASSESLNDSQDRKQEEEVDQKQDEEVWDFEPRVWLSTAKDEDDAETYFAPLEDEDLDDWGFGESFTDHGGADIKSDKDIENNALAYFARDSQARPSLNQRHAASEINLDSRGNPKRQAGKKKCNQFNVDVRDAVICDKNRCDKLDFSFPEYSNQLTLVQTTKAGMRFVREDFAFARKNQKPQLSKDLNIFDLFKPKWPRPMPMPTSTLSPSSTQTQTSLPETTTPETTTSSESPDITTTQSTPNDNNNSTFRLIATLKVDTTRLYQEIVGFGGALSDAACRQIRSLSKERAQSLVDDYFGARGLGYSIARVSIGSSDFSTTPYTNDDLPQDENSNNATDFDMLNFKLVDEDKNIKLPVIRQVLAQSALPVKMLASLWSPPVWMKNNTNIVHGYLRGDAFGPYYRSLALLIIKWLDAYAREGINFWAATGLNEPVTGIKPFIFHNSLGITRDDYVTFIKLHLGPMLSARERTLASTGNQRQHQKQKQHHRHRNTNTNTMQHQQIKLLALDDNKGYAHKWLGAVYNDARATKFVAGAAVHWYMNDEYENLNFLTSKHPDKLLISSEACNGYLPFQVHVLPGNWDRGVAYSLDVLRLTARGSSAWIDWNLALDLSGGPNWAQNLVDSPIIVNSRLDEYYKSPMFYALGHFSRFVTPGARRVGHKLINARFDYPLEASVFLSADQKHLIAVVTNANNFDTRLKLAVDGKLVRELRLRAQSFNTLVFKWKHLKSSSSNLSNVRLN